MKKLLIIFLFIILILSLFAQTAPDTLWTKTYGGSYEDGASSVQQTEDEGFIIAGYTYSYGVNNDDNFWLIKTDENGNLEWEQIFGGSDSEKAIAVQQTIDDGYIVAGYTGSYGAGHYDFWLIKTDENGNQQWDQTFGSSDWEIAYSVQQTTDGGYIIAGDKADFNAGGFYIDFWLVKTNEDGIEEWNQTYGGTSFEGAYSVHQTVDEGYIVAGYTESYGAGQEDFWLVKIDENGNQQWDQTFGGSYEDRAHSVQQTADEGYIVTGYTFSYGTGDLNCLLIKTDVNGNLEWEQILGGNNDDSARSVKQTVDGGYIVAGYTESYGAGQEDFWLVKIDENGNLQWEQTIGGSNAEGAGSVQQTVDEGYIATGFTQSYGAGNSDIWLVRLGSESIVDEYIIQNQEFKI